MQSYRKNLLCPFFVKCDILILLAAKDCDFMESKDISRGKIWRLFFFNYLKLSAAWILLWILFDIYSVSSSGLYGFARGWLLVYWTALFMVLNPLIAGIKTFITLMKTTGGKSLRFFVPSLTIFMFSALIVISPWIISPVHTQIYKGADQKTVASLEALANKEQRFDIQVVNYKNKEEFFSSNWLALRITLRIDNFSGFYFYDIENILKQVDFKRDTEIYITITNSPDQDEYYTRYFYNYSTKKLSGL